MQQCRFAGARTADDRHVLARLDRPGHAVENGRVSVPESNVVELDGCLNWCRIDTSHRSNLGRRTLLLNCVFTIDQETEFRELAH
jgi:hypothetical protein